MKLGSLLAWIGHPLIGHTGRNVSDDCPVRHASLTGRAFSAFETLDGVWAIGTASASLAAALMIIAIALPAMNYRLCRLRPGTGHHLRARDSHRVAMTVPASAPETAPPTARPRAAMVIVGRVVTGLLLPLAVYYGLRAADVTVYLSLLASALVSAVPALVGLARHGRVNSLSMYFTVMVVGSVAVSLVAGSTELLLAKEAVLTGVTGVWFLVSVRAGGPTSRPLTYSFSKPLLEGRLRWPDNFEQLWATSSRWRRMWRVSSVVFGIGTLADAVLRVVFAYTLPTDVVPALATALYAATSVLLIVLTNVYYLVCGVQNRQSALFERDLTG